MHDQGKSDRSVVPKKPSNKLATATSDRDHGEPYTGTKAETPDTDKGKPTVAEHDADEGAEAVEEGAWSRRTRTSKTRTGPRAG
jgi:hypothetical protein